MKWFRLLFVLPLAALVAACGGTTYQVPADEAHDKLSNAAPPLEMEMVEGLHDRIRVSKMTDGTVRWLLVDADGRGIAQVIATIEPSGAAAAEVTLGDEDLQNGDGEGEPQLVELFTRAIREHVDATMTNRTFNLAALGPDILGEFVEGSFKQTSRELESSIAASDPYDAAGADMPALPSDYVGEHDDYAPDTLGNDPGNEPTTLDMGDETWGANAQH